MNIDSLLPYLVVAAIAGAGMVTGLLFAFSNFIMRALAELPPEHGMAAMQKINVKIINPIFVLFFLGTPLLCVVIAIHSLLNGENPQRVWLIAGCTAYLIGPLGITARCNVPLNNVLAKVKPTDGPKAWNDYQVTWQRWNHIRTYIGLIAIILLCLGLAGTP